MRTQCPFDIEPHREVWFDGYNKAIQDALEWLERNAYMYVSVSEHDGVMIPGFHTDFLLRAIEDALINGKEIIRVFDGKEIKTVTREYKPNRERRWI